MKPVFTIVLFSFLSVGAFACKPDTIQNWQLYRGKQLILHGNRVQSSEILISEFQLTREPLRLFYNYDSVGPRQQHVEIRDGDKRILLVTFDKNPAVLNLYDALQHLSARKYHLSIYYWVGPDTEKQWLGDITVIE
ncbi:MAG TPA: hypothetical protein PLX35_06260 [Cyclobacteriaceae bacterium]|nr:hypothetical protein [Cyclobacteriaceae bacterium]